MAESSKPSFSKSRRWLMWFNTIVGVIAVLALVAMANYLASGHFKRFQTSSRLRHEITPQTQNLLSHLTKPVNVTIFFDQQENEQIYSLTLALLKQYSYANHNIHVETVDYTRSPGKAAVLLSQYKLANLKDKNFVIFDCEGRTKIVNGNDLYNYDINSLLSGQSKEIRRESFKGELLFSSAIFSVTYPRQAKAYFVYGHGEHDPENSASDVGYAKFAALLKDEANIDWQRLSLFGTNEIPDDCQLLIIAGPGSAHFQESELAKVESYLKQGRRLLVLLNNIALGNASGIENVLAKWNLAVLPYKIEDKGFQPTGDDLIPAQLNGNHPIMKSLVAAELKIYLVLPRAIFPQASTNTPPAGAPQVEFLAATSTNSVGLYQMTNSRGVLETYQKPGPFPLIAAVEHGSIKNVSTQRGVTRIVVIGDSLCFDNQLLDSWSANHYFANSVVNWLVDRPEMLLSGIGPRPITEYKLLLTNEQSKKLRWLLLAGMPGAVLLFGGIVWLRRRS
jgi:hypothetical protein